MLGEPEGKIVLVMTGGSGQFVEWPEKIARAWIPGTNGRIHVIIVAGNNREYVERYDRAYTRKREPPSVTGDGPNGRYLWETKPHGVTLEIATDAANTHAQDRPFYVLDKRLHDCSFDRCLWEGTGIGYRQVAAPNFRHSVLGYINTDLAKSRT